MRYRIRISRTSLGRDGLRRDEETTVYVKWMTVRQISDYLQISAAKVYQMAQTGEIPCCRLGQQWRFEREEIDRWLRRTLKAIEDLERR